MIHLPSSTVRTRTTKKPGTRVLEEVYNVEFLDRIGSWAHWTLRVALASTFLFHGLPKFWGLSQFAEGIGMSVAVAFLVPVAEVGGALLVLLGGALGGSLGDLATRLGALAFIPVMIGAITMVHWPRWSFEPAESFPVGGMEFQVILILLSLFLVLRGNSVKSRTATS